MRSSLRSWLQIKAVNHMILKNANSVSAVLSSRRFNSDRENDGRQRNYLMAATFAAGFLGYQIYSKNSKKAFLKAAGSYNKDKAAGSYIDGLPNYNLDEVSKHSNEKDKIWVTYKRGVYDITEFVSQHPGGEQILLAAGSSVEPFWLLYAAHNSAQVYEMLEGMRIGNLSLEDATGPSTQDSSDPYANDPIRHGALEPASMKPFNAEPPASLLVDSFITPNELFYVRNHLPVPDIDPNLYELEIECEGRDKTMTFTLDQIKMFPKHTVTASIMCAGNRRSEMTAIKSVKGLSWQNAAIGNAEWSGARLKDILRAAGISEDDTTYKHIQFEGLDTDPTNTPYGASIPFWKGTDKRGDVIVAYEMNGVPIPRDHGYPIRVIVPGVVGARNVKWLGKIVVSCKESDSHWQQNDYKGFSPSVDWDTVDFTKSPAIQELPVTSSICRPAPNDSVKVIDGHITVQGYAWSGGGQQIVRVDVTADGGATWHVATFDAQDVQPPPQHWSWTLWTAKIPIPKGKKNVEIWCKAVDSAYNTQPESFQNIWNLRGVLSNAYHRVSIGIKW